MQTNYWMSIHLEEEKDSRTCCKAHSAIGLLY
jgi:hypothetical protein